MFHHENLLEEAMVFWTRTALAMRGGGEGGGAGWEAEVGQVVG